MASTVINDPTALNKYRGEIYQRIQELQKQLKATEESIQQCNDEGWKDGNFTEFQNNFEQDKNDIAVLCDGLNVYYEDILAGLEQKLRGYTDELTFSSPR